MSKILIMGAGSVGVYLGTLLFSKGHSVILVGGSKLSKLGKTIIIRETPYELPTRAHTLPKNEEFDYVFVTSKLYDLKDNLIRLFLKNKIRTRYLGIVQNGIVDQSIYKSYVENMKFSSISVFEGFRLSEDQLTISSSGGGWETNSSEAGKKIAILLRSVGINCSTNEDLEIVKAEKTIMNCSVNLLSAIEKKTVFEICNDSEMKKVVDKLFNESYDVLSHLFELSGKEKLRKKFYETIAPLKHYSSTYQDAISGRRTEIEFLNEYIVKLGKEYGIPTPANDKVVAKFKRIYRIK